MQKIHKILLIDDDNINNYINKRLLQKLDISNDIQVLLNGEEGINYIQEQCKNNEECPELIFLDINMPVMNGFEFLNAYDNLPIQNKEKVVIVMLTTSSNHNDMKGLDSYNISGFLNKPLTTEKIMHVVNSNFNEKTKSGTAHR